MRCLVCYFSPTGNTYKKCKEIIDVLKNQNHDVNMINATKREIRVKNNIENVIYDVLIVAFPVYSQRVPNVFAEYLKKIEINCRKAIIISTYGSVTSGNALAQAARILKCKGIFTYGAIAIPTEHSYKSVFKIKISPYSYSDELRKFINDAILNIYNSKTVSLKSKFVISMFLNQQLISNITLKLPKVNIKKCVRCKKCIFSCPMDAIDRNLNITTDKCIRCAACVIVCEYGARECIIKNSISRKIISKSIHGNKKLVIFT
ncbi:MAG TPA: EFR1 family ferrodoxin [Clostridia bacterium]|jgi:ferredoxin/flavodoxin|nr:MAG: flavodoxin [Firmicutes bacterium ADurb.Bin146]HOD92453.1 EFR1 family ferrodoxin [Clostridia bacterium]HQM38810.1 EFR1 family ferrodoxin [Clostridia bacterium]